MILPRYFKALLFVFFLSIVLVLLGYLALEEPSDSVVHAQTAPNTAAMDYSQVPENPAPNSVHRVSITACNATSEIFCDYGPGPRQICPKQPFNPPEIDPDRNGCFRSGSTVHCNIRFPASGDVEVVGVCNRGGPVENEDEASGLRTFTVAGTPDQPDFECGDECTACTASVIGTDGSRPTAASAVSLNSRLCPVNNGVLTSSISSGTFSFERLTAPRVGCDLAHIDTLIINVPGYQQKSVFLSDDEACVDEDGASLTDIELVPEDEAACKYDPATNCVCGEIGHDSESACQESLCATPVGDLLNLGYDPEYYEEVCNDFGEPEEEEEEEEEPAGITCPVCPDTHKFFDKGRYVCCSLFGCKLPASFNSLPGGDIAADAYLQYITPPTTETCIDQQVCWEGKGCIVTAQNPEAPPCYDENGDPASGTGGCEQVRFGDQSFFLSFPTTPGGFIQMVLGVLLSISGMVAVALIIRSGYQYMTSRGNPDAIQEARDRLTSAIVGLLFIIFSLVILQVIGVDILQIPGFGN